MLGLETYQKTKSKKQTYVQKQLFWFSNYLCLFRYYCLFNDKKIRSKGLVQGPGVQKPLGYRVIHQNSLTSCPGQSR